MGRKLISMLFIFLAIAFLGGCADKKTESGKDKKMQVGEVSIQGEVFSVTSPFESMKEKLGEYQVLRTEKVGAVIGSELTLKAVLAMLISWVIIIMYISYRFELKFALSAIAALLHDIIIVMGVFSLLQKEIDGSFVAAIMTIIGYSINDTIVIFDRIRENLKLHFRKGGDLIELINHSIMQTMTRSIYTVLTVLFTVVSLFVFGGETTKNFALALLIGISCGAYSSIFNASPLWYDLKRMADKKAN